MTKIYLIRHAEAEGNLYRRAQGHFNSNVTRLGMAQIGALAERFRDVQLDALWSSDLNRTRSTAAAILKYHPRLDLNLSPRLREIDVGVWEDLPWGNIAADWPRELWYFSHDPGKWSVPGGEPYRDVAIRMRKAILALGERYDGKTIAVVSHGLAIRALLCGHFGIPSDRIREMPYGDNTAVALLTVKDGAMDVEYYNDNAHLEERGLSTRARQNWRKREETDTPAEKIYCRLEPLDPRKEGELYSRCYRETWMASHGNLNGFASVVYLRSAELHAKNDPRCVMKLTRDGGFMGLVELDPERGAKDGAGWISLLYVAPEARNQRMGIQLIGHAVSYFRRAGRSSIRLHASQDNRNALAFYEHAGFKTVGESLGVGGKLWLLELDIRQRVLSPEEI